MISGFVSTLCTLSQGVGLTFLVLFFMMRSAAYTLSPSSILCIPSLMIVPSNWQIQMVHCNPVSAILSLHPIRAPQSDTHFSCHNSLVIRSLFKVTRANDVAILQHGDTSSPLEVAAETEAGGSSPVPRAPRPHATEPRQSAPRVHKHPLDICKQVLFSSTHSVFRPLCLYTDGMNVL